MIGYLKTYRGYSRDLTESQHHQIIKMKNSERWFAIKPTTYSANDNGSLIEVRDDQVVSARSEAEARATAERLHHQYQHHSQKTYDATDYRSYHGAAV